MRAHKWHGAALQAFCVCRSWSLVLHTRHVHVGWSPVLGLEVRLAQELVGCFSCLLPAPVAHMCGIHRY